MSARLRVKLAPGVKQAAMQAGIFDLLGVLDIVQVNTSEEDGLEFILYVREVSQSKILEQLQKTQSVTSVSPHRY